MGQEIYFTHPKTQRGVLSYKGLDTGLRPCLQPDGSLKIPTGANSMKWSYGLNTVTYPTYGGEVVQILSAYIDDLSLGGDVNSYKMMEDIYVWFLIYLNISTQGGKNAGLPDEPVTLWYPHREWVMKIRPKTLPNLHMGRDVVVPTWQMTASIVEGDPEAEAYTLRAAMEGLKEVQAGIGFEPENPFSSAHKGATYDSASTEKTIKQVVDWYGKIVESYQEDDLSSLDTTTGARPAKQGKPSTKVPTKDKPSSTKVPKVVRNEPQK